MKKRILLFSILVFSALLLTACGSAGKNEVVIIDEETGEEIVVLQEELDAQQQELNEYSQHLNETFSQSISLQDTFAHALDNLFTKEASAGQFAKILKDDIITQSREILDKAEKYNFPKDYYEMNQMVVMNLNNQHQLFLDAVNEATIVAETEDTSIDIVSLRERLVELKQDYLAIVNAWKNGGQVDY